MAEFTYLEVLSPRGDIEKEIVTCGCTKALSTESVQIATFELKSINEVKR